MQDFTFPDVMYTDIIKFTKSRSFAVSKIIVNCDFALWIVLIIIVLIVLSLILPHSFRTKVGSRSSTAGRNNYKTFNRRSNSSRLFQSNMMNILLVLMLWCTTCFDIIVLENVTVVLKLMNLLKNRWRESDKSLKLVVF